MAWWLWVLVGVGILATFLYAIMLFFGVSMLRMKPSDAARELYDDAAEAAIAHVEKQAEFASSRAWQLLSVLEVKLLGSTMYEVVWELEPGTRYFIGSMRGEGSYPTSFLTVMRSRASHERVFLVTADQRSVALDMPQDGYIAESFSGANHVELERRHTHAINYLRDTGMCELHATRASILDLYIESMELQIRWFKRSPIRVLLSPALFFHAITIRAGKPIEKRYPQSSKAMRRLRGEIMHSPRSHL